VRDAWDDCDVWIQAKLIAYEQTRQHEELETQKALLGVSKGKAPTSPTRRRGGGRRR